MTTASISIEKNVPLKTSKGVKYPLEKMEVGDSFDAGEYSTEKARSVSGSIAYFKTKKGNKRKVFSCRKTDEGTIRVWRTA